MPTLATFAILAATLLVASVAAVMLLWRLREPARADGARILAEQVVDLVSTHDGDGNFRFVSSAFARLLGASAQEVIGKHPQEFAHPDDTQAITGLFKRAVALSGSASTVTWRCRKLGGNYAWLETTARIIAGDAGHGSLVCASRDITERKQIEDALRDSEQRFRTTVETVRLVAVGLDARGRITFCNDSLCSLTGWPKSEVIGENWFDRFVPQDDPSRTTFYDHIAGGDIPPKAEHEIICRDGKRRMIEWDNTVLRSALGQVIGTASLGVDVTERRQEQAALKLLQSVTLSISAADDLGAALVLTLEALSTATGWGYGEAWLPNGNGSQLERTTTYAAVGVNAGPLISAVAGTKLKSGEGLPGHAWQSKSVVWAPDLTAFSSEHSPELGTTAIDCGFRSAVALPVLSGQDVCAVLVFFMDRPRSTDARHTQMVFVVLNQIGTVIERRQAQKKYEAAILRARDEAEAASRAKSDFLSRMSHELRTPLNSVIGFASVMRKNKTGRLNKDDVAFLDRIVANGQHLLMLVNDILDIAKVEAGRLTVTTGIVAVDQLVRDVAAQLEGQPRSPSVRLAVEVPAGELVPIETDGVLLRQVIINLAGNALRFTHDGSVVIAVDGDLATGVPLRVHVRDTGIGIEAERRLAIFEPFEQADAETHRTYGGTGLGLSISKAICDELGFRLTVDSDVGKGSTFTIHLQDGASREDSDSVSDSDRSVPISDSLPPFTATPKSRQTQRQ